jgi:hypothetical protein
MNSRRKGNRLYFLYNNSVYWWAVTGYRLGKLGSVFIMSTIYKEGRKEGRKVRGRYLQVSICSLFRSIPTTIHTLPESSSRWSRCLYPCTFPLSHLHINVGESEEGEHRHCGHLLKQITLGDPLHWHNQADCRSTTRGTCVISIELDLSDITSKEYCVRKKGEGTRASLYEYSKRSGEWGMESKRKEQKSIRWRLLDGTSQSRRSWCCRPRGLFGSSMK